MSELARPREPIEDAADRFHEEFRERGVIELTLRRLEERHFGLLRIREP